MVSAGWALELRGHPFDLEDLEESLQPPFDPWVEKYREGGERFLLLRSNAWKTLASMDEMMADAARLIDHINGMLLLGQSDAEPISHGITFRFSEDGIRMPVATIIRVTAATLTYKGGRLRARASVGTAHIAKEPTSSIMQLRLQAADREQVISDLLTFIKRADNWSDLYKGMESVERLAGGEAAVQALSSDWKRVRRTANRHRHAPSSKYTLPNNPPTIAEARMILIDVARHVVDRLAMP